MSKRRGKVSVSLPAELIEEIDRGVAEERYASRSAAIEASLRSWVCEQRDVEIEQYYRSLTAEERSEAQDWGELGYQTLSDTTKRDERVESGPRSKARRRRLARR